jgi:hypothetical protein
MTRLKLFLLIAITWLGCLIYSGFLDTPVKKITFHPGSSFANKEREYTFDVPENGTFMRFEVNGRVALKTWKSIELRVFGPDNQYMFTIKDELWAESGRDADGSWTEYKDTIRVSQRFPRKGTYTAILYDEQGPHYKRNNSEYYFRVVALNGDASKLTLWLWILGIILAWHVFYGFNYLKGNGENNNPYQDKSSGFSVSTSLIMTSLVILPTMALCMFAIYKDDEPINWVYISSSHKSITSERQMREHSLGSAGFRTSGSLGGK